MVKTDQFLGVIVKFHRCFLQAKNTGKLHMLFVDSLVEILDGNKFGIFRLDPSENIIRPLPESFNTMESLGAAKIENEILEQLLENNPKTLSFNNMTLIPHYTGRLCSSFILVKKELNSEECDVIRHISMLWHECRDKMELESDNNRLAGELGRSLHNLSVVRSVAQTVGKAHDIKHLLSLILKVAITTVNASRGFIMLENENSHELELRVAHGLPNEEAEKKINAGLLDSARISRGEGIQGRVMESKEPVIINNIFAEEEAFFGLDSHSKSLMCVPLIMHDTAFGVIYLTSKQHEEPFDKEDLDVIAILSSHASAVLDQSRLYALASTDDLTGLFTRRYYSQKIGDEYKRALRYKRHLAMIVIDIDFFKKINDEFGHPAGDFVLKRIAKVLKSAVRIDVDTAVRFGGEEFILILPETHLTGASIVGERIRKTIEEELIIYDGKLIPVTLSVGISAYPENGSAIEELFNLADRALYASKANGRNCVSTIPES